MTITEALRSAARYVDDQKSTLVWGEPDLPSDKRAHSVELVSSLGREIESLAAASETSPVFLREYETISTELQRLGFTLPREIAQVVIEAFLVAIPPKASPDRRPSLKVRRIAS